MRVTRCVPGWGTRSAAAARGPDMNERAFYRRFVESDELVADTCNFACTHKQVNQFD